MFRKTDRQDLQNIPAAISALRIQSESKERTLLALLNELGQVAGRIEAYQKASTDSIVGGIVAARADISKWRDEIVTQLVAHPHILAEHVNNIQTLVRMVNESQKNSYDRLQEEFIQRISCIMSRSDMTNNAIVALSTRLGLLTGLVEAEVSEASAFRKEMRRKEQKRKGKRK